MEIQFTGKSTGVGAFEDAAVFGPDGQEVPASNTETSKTGNHWNRVWNLPDEVTYLMCVTASNGRGRDDSYTKSVGTVRRLSPAQELVEQGFLQQHGSATSQSGS